MEQIYPPESFGASVQFPLKRYFEEFNEIPTAEVPQKSSDNQGEDTYLLNLKALMGVDIQLDDLKRLSESCSVDHLICEGENTEYPIDVPDNINASTKLPFEYIHPKDKVELAVHKYHTEMGKQIKNLEQNLRNKRSYHKDLKVNKETTANLAPGSDFVISILVYRPFAFNYHEKNASEKLRFNQEILALGSNSLCQLRDTIMCSSDHGLCKEVETPLDDIKDLGDAKAKYPSGFFFIDDIFYNDFRESNSIDYSYPIVAWAKQNKIKDFECRNMYNVTLDSLTPRFGFPYLYMHQGDCEHLLVFSDAKRLDQNDCLNLESYPYISKINRSSNIMCCLCTTSLAKWICVESERLPQNKTFLCTECCNAYNYIDGEKIGRFKLFPFFEKHVVT